MQSSDGFEMFSQPLLNSYRKHRQTILVSLTALHHNLVRAKIEILYAKSQAFKHAQSGPV